MLTVKFAPRLTLADSGRLARDTSVDHSSWEEFSLDRQNSVMVILAVITVCSIKWY